MENENQQSEGTKDGESLDLANKKPAPGSADGSTVSPDGGTDATAGSFGEVVTSPPKLKQSLWKRIVNSLNVYVLFFALLLIAAGAIMAGAYIDSKKGTTAANLSSKGLTASTLSQLANSNTAIGTTGQILNVESDTVFAGQVLVRQDLAIAGNLQIGGTLSLNNIVVSGTSQFGEAQVNKSLAVAGDSSLQGNLTVAKSIQTNGGATFGGSVSAPQVTTSSLELSGDLDLTHHIVAGGVTPNRSDGGALGSGGTSSVSGSDTAGSVKVNIGQSPVAGCFITITFSEPFNATPHVLVTPIGSAAAGVQYYVTRSATNFSICSASTPPASSSFGFDYFVVD
jgi:cytoskeletal protein CcmA (bactofilin family)